jgi:hypothetical protein
LRGPRACRDVEQDDFVGSIPGVPRGLRRRVAGVDDVDKLDAFHYAAGVDVEAGDDALGNQLVPFASHSRKLRRIFKPVVPDFSG